MKFCPGCNHELLEGDKFCSNCGLNLHIQDSSNLDVNNNQNGIFYNPPGVNQITQNSKQQIVNSSYSNPQFIRQTGVKTLSIKSLLKSNGDYHHRNKKAVLEIDKMIDKNEQIIYALTGELFIENLTGTSHSFGYISSAVNNNFVTTAQSNGFYRNGVICITDKRTIFVTNSDKIHSVREFSNSEILGVLLDKMYKSGRLKIQTSKGDYVFSIIKYENAQKFLQIIKTVS